MYRKHLHATEARLQGVLAKHQGTRDGFGGCSLRISHDAGQAGDHARISWLGVVGVRCGTVLAAERER